MASDARDSSSDVRFIGSLPVDYTKGSPRTVAVDREGYVYTVTSNGKVLRYQISGE